MFKKSTIIAGLFGNALEWYDFILYANLAPVIAHLFFPTKNPITSLLLTFFVFATGFLIRPLGAFIFGYLGDTYGRKKALVVSIVAISLPTLLIGILPTYNQIGILAALLLTLLRLFQGLAVSGELNSASTFLIEHAPDNRRGFAGSLVMGTAFFGMLIGALLVFLITWLLPTTALYAWGWRIPFWIGGILGIIGLIVRLKTHESPKFLQENAIQRFRLLQIFSRYRKELILTFLVTIIMAVGNYIFLAYIITFLKLQGFPIQSAETINLIGMFVIVLLFPIVGILSDKIGRKPMFKMGLWGFIILSIPIFWLLSQKQFSYILFGDILFVLVLAPISALIPTLLAELFPTHVRNSGSALGYNLCLSIFGGTAPLIAITLNKITQNTLAPAGYLIVCAIVSYCALHFIVESHHKPLRSIS